VSVNAAPRLAVFDLDGTVTRGDTYIRFVAAALRRWPVRGCRVPLLLVPALQFVFGLSDRGKLKGAILHTLFDGLPRAELRELAERFARHVGSTLVHLEAAAAIAQHRACGDRLVLMSASPDVYVPLVALHLGFDECICTPLRWAGDRFDGRLAGPNCRGERKSEHLRELRRAYAGLPAIAYGNSSADLDHMRLCEAAVYVNAGAGERPRLQTEGIATVTWR
jgi:phosphatidylglycerophosphatase C